MPRVLLTCSLLLALTPPLSAQPRLDLHGDPLPPGALARLGSVRWRHAGPITQVVYSPDGKLLASSSHDGTVRLWDPETGKEVKRLVGHKAHVTSLAFSPDGKLLVSGSSFNITFTKDGNSGHTDESNNIRLWEVATGRELRQFKGHETEIVSLALSRDGTFLAAGGAHGRLYVWELDDPKPKKAFEAHKDYWACHVALSADGKLLATGGGDSLIRLWDTSKWQELRVLKGHRSKVTALAFAHDGLHLASGGGYDAREVRLWPLTGGAPSQLLGMQSDNVSRVVFSRDSKVLVSGSQAHQNAVLWDVEKGKKIHTHWTKPPVPTGFRSLDLSPDGKVLAAAHGDSMIRLYDARTGAPLHRYPGHSAHVYSVAFHPKGELLASGGGEYAWRLWDIASAKELHVCPEQNDAVSCLQFTRDGQTLIANGNYAHVGIWDVATRRRLRQTAAWAGTPMLLAADEDTLVTGNWHKSFVHFWSLNKNKELKKLPLSDAKNRQGHAGTLAISPDGKLLAVGGSSWIEASIRLFDMKTGEMKRTLPGHNQGTCTVAFSPDGKLLASVGEEDRGSGDRVRLWNPTSGAQVGELGVEPNLQRREPPVPARTLAFAPDGTLAVTGCDGIVRLWDVTTRRELRQLDGQQGWVVRLAFSQDGRLLATAGADGTVLLWQMGKQ